MNLIIKKIILIILLVTFFLPSVLWGDSEEKVLTGVSINHGWIIDGVKPIYRHLNENGELGDELEGIQYGGTGGVKETYERQEHVITGFRMEYGYFAGRMVISKIVVVTRKWNPELRIPDGKEFESKTFGMGREVERPTTFNLSAPNQSFIYELTGKTSAHTALYLEDIKLNLKFIETRKFGEAFLDEKWVGYEFQVDIVSGSKIGKKLTGFFYFNPGKLIKKGDESIPAESIHFTFDGIFYDISSLDTIPLIYFQDGVLTKVGFIAGKKEIKFGLNPDFFNDSFQIYEKKMFIENANYFAYQDNNKFIDGIGKVTYILKK